MTSRCRSAAAVLTLASGAAALPPTKIQTTDCCAAAGCLAGDVHLDIPASTYPTTPRFAFNVSAVLPEGSTAGVSPTYHARGSLGLPKHPLGIFKFNVVGPACGRQHVYVEGGTLADVTFDFPPCPWAPTAGSVLIPGRADVWTVIPAVKVDGPVDVAVGFTITLELFPAAAPALRARDVCAGARMADTTLPCGDQITNPHTDTADECCALCAQNPACTHWVFHPNSGKKNQKSCHVRKGKADCASTTQGATAGLAAPPPAPAPATPVPDPGVCAGARLADTTLPCGDVITKPHTDTADECCTLCAQNPACTHWAFVPGKQNKNHECHVKKGKADCATTTHGATAGLATLPPAPAPATPVPVPATPIPPAPPAPPAPAPAPPAQQQLMCQRIDLWQPFGKGTDREQDHCNMNMRDPPQYPPTLDNMTIPWETIDLDEDPATRWNNVVIPRAAEILSMIDQFITGIDLKDNVLLRTILAMAGNDLLKKLPPTYAAEINGIHTATGINIGYLFVYNIMYELMGFCTSMVSQDAAGHVYHARNLDFGEFVGGFDNVTHNWALTPKLRPLLVNLRWVKGGKELYNTTAFAGYVGLLTGAKAGGFAISVNTRFDANVDQWLLRWLAGLYEGELLSFKTRDVMEGVASYADAERALSTYKPMGPAYIIISGAAAGEGAVIQLGAKSGDSGSFYVRKLSDALGNGSFYVLESNYDWPQGPPTFDDRRYPAEGCLDKLGSANISWASLFGVFSSNPTLNAATTYTTLMSAQTGKYESYKQLCVPGPDCVPF